MAGASVAERVQKLNTRISAAVARAGRSSGAVRLLAVSKFQELNKIREAYECGQRDFAENYVQEAVGKQEQLENLPVRWHFIGRIQSNKVKFLAGKFWAIHSVDRVSIAEALNRLCAERNVVQNVFLQFNIAGEESKAGAGERELADLFESACRCSNLRVLGLMVMPPLEASPEEARGFFARARKELERLRGTLAEEIRRRHPCDELSMGTSHDFETAIEEGATWIRIGTDVFGPREEKL